MKNSWTVIVEEDENGDAILPFPDDMIQALGWAEGDILEYDIKDQCIVVTNTTADERKKQLGSIDK